MSRREQPGASGARGAGPVDDSFRIVLNYRREDTSGHAGRLYDALAARFGEDHVFMDIDKIDPGEEFARVIERAIDASDVFLALIGSEWLTATDARGRRRLENRDDFVRIEIETALARDVRVIPVLLQGAEMPGSDELPDPIRGLARRNAVEVRDTSWRSDVERLADALARIRESGPAPGPAAPSDEAERLPPPPEDDDNARSRLPFVVAGAVVLVAAAAFAAFFVLRDGGSIGSGRIAYFDGTQRAVLYMASDGSDATILPGSGAGDRDPDWSHDGSRLVLSRDEQVWIVPLDEGENATRVIPSDGGEEPAGGGPYWQPAWGVEDRALAFERNGSEVWIVDLAGDRVDGDFRNLTDEGGRPGAGPDWSFDGELVAFQWRNSVSVMQVDGGEARSARELVRGGIDGAPSFPAWAPNDNRLAVVLTGGGRCRIVVVDVDPALEPTGDATPVHDGPPRTCQDVAWSPDGTQIAFADAGTASEDGTGIYVVDLEGGDPELVKEGARLRSLAWGPEP